MDYSRGRDLRPLITLISPYNTPKETTGALRICISSLSMTDGGEGAVGEDLGDPSITSGKRSGELRWGGVG